MTDYDHHFPILSKVLSIHHKCGKWIHHLNIFTEFYAINTNPPLRIIF